MKREKKIAVIVFALILIANNFSPKAVSAQSISANAGILMEQESGRVLFEKNPHQKMRIASITKIMTAILAIESGKLNEIVKVSKKAIYTEGSSIYLQQGEEILLKDLVYGLMLRSGNDAAYSIAEHVGGSLEGFVYLMNQKAEEIGMSNTVFSNPHGLDDHEEHYSTAYDMSILTRYAMKNKVYQEIAGTKIHKFQRGELRQSWGNKNRLLTEKYKYCTGGKTGFTKRAGRTLVTTATKNDLDLIAVTINAGDDWNDHITMYENAFNQYTLQTILDSGTLDIDTNGIENKELFTKSPIHFPLTKNEEKYIEIEYKLLHPKDLEKKKEGSVGFAILSYQHEPVQKVPIYIREQDEKETRNWWQQLLDKLFSKMGMMDHD